MLASGVHGPSRRPPNLLLRALVAVALSGCASGKSSGVAPASDAASSVFLFEDFSAVAEGALPKGWLGGGEMTVGKVGRRPALYTTAQGSAVITAVAFPESFRIELLIALPNVCGGQYAI